MKRQKIEELEKMEGRIRAIEERRRVWDKCIEKTLKSREENIREEKVVKDTTRKEREKKISK